MEETYGITVTKDDQGIQIENIDELINTLKALFSGCRVNFLLGAGFSAGILKTLGNYELFLEALRTMHANDSNKDKLIVLKAYVQWIFFIECIEPIGNLKAGDIRLQNHKNFADQLRRILNEKANPVLNRQYNIFTTNYDPVIEIAFDDSSCICNDGFEGRINPVFSTDNYSKIYFREGLFSNRKAEIPSINLIKLHGSVTWKMNQTTDDMKLEYTDYRKLIQKFKDKYHNNFSNEIIEEVKNKMISSKWPNSDEVSLIISEILECDLLEDETWDTEPYEDMLKAYDEQLLIVKPTKEKFSNTLLNKNYYELLRIFSNELEKENSLLLTFGFSFNDEHILDLTKRALINPSLKLLVICYSENDLKMYKSKFVNLKNNNVSYLYPESGSIDLETLNSIFLKIHA